MSFINQFPYSDAHELNLDWVLKTMKELALKMNDFEAANSIDYVGEWDVTKQYSVWDVVTTSDYAFMALKNVPAGIPVSNTEYWRMVAPITVDQNFNETSLNPISNKTVTNKIHSIETDISTLNTNLSSETSSRIADSISIHDNLDAIENDLAAEETARTNADDLINTRIDNIIALTPGSTTGDAELADIRIWFNGEESDTAGDAVRGQAQLLSDEIDDINENIADQTLSVINQNNLTYVGNYYPGAGGDKTELAGYYAFQVVALADFDVWVPDEINNDTVDPIIAVFNDGTWDHAHFVSPRYRYPNLPTASNKLTVEAGQLFVIALYNVQNFSLYTDGFLTGKKTLTDNIVLGPSQVEQIENKIIVDKSTNLYNITFGKCSLALEHETSAADNKDLWTIRGIYSGSTVICNRGTDIIGVLQEQGQADFMGGLHGDEICTSFKIYADGTEIAQSTTCKKLDIYMISNLYRPSDHATNVIDRVVHIEIQDNRIDITTTFICKINGFHLDYAYNGGMFAWYDTSASYQASNIGIINANSGTSSLTLQQSNQLVQTFANINGCNVTVENIIGHEKSTYDGEVYYYGSSDKRIKTYFSTDHGSTWNEGHVCTGKFRFRFS